MEIITIANYREQYPADQYQDNLITTAINMSFDILNYKYSGNVIAERWEKVEEAGGFTDTQKEHIRRAFLIQSRYYLQTGLRQATGSIQRTSGSVGININVPNRDEVQQGAILALEAARITSLMSSQGGKVRGINECDEINLSKFATIDLVKAMCVQTQYTASEGMDQKANKLITWNEDGIAQWIGLEQVSDYINLSNYYTKVECNDIFLTKEESNLWHPTFDWVRTYYQSKQDNNLLTTDKTIVGAINEIKESVITVDITPRTFENETLNSGTNLFINRFNLPVNYSFEILGVVSTRARMQDDDRPLPMAITLINKENYQGYNIYIQSLIFNNSTSITDNLTINIKLLIRKV